MMLSEEWPFGLETNFGAKNFSASSKKIQDQ